MTLLTSKQGGNRIVGVARTFATAKQVQTKSEADTVITLPSIGGAYTHVAGVLLLDGVPCDQSRPWITSPLFRDGVRQDGRAS